MSICVEQGTQAFERDAHAHRVSRLQAWLRAPGDPAPLGLSKRSSNLFRDRAESPKRRLDLGEFTHVIEVDTERQWVDVEGSASYEELVDATLPRGVMPAVVPQLKTITVGGAAAGVGIEATSFREGLVHHTLLELEVLQPSGEVVTCTPHNEHRDLFRGFANSYGTLGYALRLRLRTRPVGPYVRVQHQRFEDSAAFFGAMRTSCEACTADFVDGVIFDRNTLVLNTASFVDTAPWLSDYGFERIYYRSLLETDLDYLRVKDYLWRWDTDWFWCSKNFGAQHSWVRRLLGRSRLNSRTYTRLMRWNARLGLTHRLASLRGLHSESVIQDVDIPAPRATEFLDFLLREIGIVPIWVCPLREAFGSGPFTLYPLTSDTAYVNFGFWDVVRSRAAHAPGHFNRLVEREVSRLGGIKSLYSDSFFTRDEFAATYDMTAYAALKAKYDPESRLLSLYEKCVLRG
jgi:FAD/FMN-containing dehydrogenase